MPKLFKEKALTQSITCLRNNVYDLHAVDATNTDFFPYYAHVLCETYCPWEFEQAAKDALACGMFFSIQQFDKKQTNYGLKRPPANIETHAVILTCKVKREDCMMISQDKVVVLHGMGIEGNSTVLPLDGNGDYRGYVTQDIHDENFITCLVPLIMDFDGHFFWDICQNDGSELVELTALLLTFQENLLVPEGVAIVDGFVPELLHSKLMNQINDLADDTDSDYHPRSNKIIRDLVHPSLYAYVNGLSRKTTIPLVPPEVFPKDIFFEKRDDFFQDFDVSLRAPIMKDYWGRAYEGSSRYQWLPTYFDISCDGTCTIEDYINNLLPRSNYEPLYDSLAQLFSHALPLIESVFSYDRIVRNRIMSANKGLIDDTISFVPPIKEDYYSLRGRKLQVVTKIVDYELSPGATYEGVWHVEGMSHEEIVATAIYFIHRDEDIEGGDIYFKRAFHNQEALLISSRTDQNSQLLPSHLERVIEDGMLPLGMVKTLQRRLLVFPNSHVHKVSEMENMSYMNDTNTSDSIQKRRIIVFLLVNPEKRIVSTREVPPQSAEHGGKMSRQEHSNTG